MSLYLHKTSLRLENLGCDRGGVPIVRGIDLSLPSGEAVQLFGSNGSGKSTILNCLAGHLRLAEGRIRWQQGGADQQLENITNDLVFIGHKTPLKSSLTVYQNLAFWAQSYGVSKPQQKDAVYGALERMCMLAQVEMRAGLLSAGQRRRLDIARAVIARRSVWLMDEPAAAIDQAGAGQLCTVLTEHLERGGTAIIATHDPLDIQSQKLVIG